MKDLEVENFYSTQGRYVRLCAAELATCSVQRVTCNLQLKAKSEKNVKCVGGEGARKIKLSASVGKLLEA